LMKADSGEAGLILLIPHCFKHSMATAQGAVNQYSKLVFPYRADYTLNSKWDPQSAASKQQ
jgi:hypothetical protein